MSLHTIGSIALSSIWNKFNFISNNMVFERQHRKTKHWANLIQHNSLLRIISVLYIINAIDYKHKRNKIIAQWPILAKKVWKIISPNWKFVMQHIKRWDFEGEVNFWVFYLILQALFSALKSHLIYQNWSQAAFKFCDQKWLKIWIVFISI